MDLHIGVTSSTGTIVEFDKNGLRRHRNSQWDQCLLLDQAEQPWIEHWDNTLLQVEICLKIRRKTSNVIFNVPQVCKQKCWVPWTYDEDKHNCYTFVLTFLKTLNYGGLSKAAMSRTAFCEKFIVPRTTSAGKYISLYRKLKDLGFYVHRSGRK